MKQKVNKIILIAIIILFVVSSVLTNSIKEYYTYVKIAGYCLITLYFIIRIIQKRPIKIIKNKFDIFILILVISTIIPVISNKYVSLYGSIQTILEYIFVFGMYILIREISKEEKRTYKILCNTLIITSIVLVIVGIDGITSNVLGDILKDIGLGNFVNGDNRLISVFGYSNTFAVYIASILFLSINEYLRRINKSDERIKVVKAFYKTVTFILVFGIILTYSKAILLMLPIALFVFVFCIKEKDKKVELVQNIIISFVIALIYSIIFEKLANMQNYLLMWLTLVTVILVNYLINLIIEKNIIEKGISLKKNFIFFYITCLIVLIYFIIGLNIYDEYKVFVSNVESNYKAKVISNLEGNRRYLLEFDIVAKAPRDIENTYAINIIERDEKNRKVNETQIEFGTYRGVKNIELITKESTREIKIEFKSKYQYREKELTVKKLYINKKEIPLKYKLLPTKLVEKVKNIRINYKTSQERLIMMKDALKLSKENLLTGTGGDAWKCKYKDIRSYEYSAECLHSYPAKIIVEFGVLGVISYIGIASAIVITLVKAIKNQRIEILSIVFAIAIIAIHSIIDLDMEFIHMLIYVVALIGMLEKNEKEKFNKLSYVSSVGLVILMIISGYLTLNPKIYNMYEEISDILISRNGLVVNSQEYKEKNLQVAKNYENIGSFERYNELGVYENIIKYYLNSDISNKLDIIEKYYSKILEYDNKNINSMSSITGKMQCVYYTINNLEDQDSSLYYEITEKFAKIIINEYENVKEQLEKCAKKQGIDVSDDIDFLDIMYEDAQRIDDKYLLGVKIYNDSGIEISEQELENLKIEPLESALIYHTHATESYKSDKEYETYEFYKSIDENYNVLKVGDYLTELLKKRNVNVIHNREYHNYPVASGAYGRSRNTVSEILNENKSINRIIDVHRDAISEEEHEASTIQINGEEVAKLMFVVGINKDDENWMYDLKWVIEMQKIADQKYPGLFNPILIRERDYYNQDLSKYSALLEVGENCNKIEHVLNSIKYFSEIFF